MTLKDLIIKKEVEEMILKHARSMDENQNEAADAGFAEDAIMEAPTGETLRVADIPKERKVATRAGLKPRIITNMIVDVISPDRANAFCYVTLPRENLPQGEWHYQLKKLPEGWKITHYKVVPVQRPG
jgi:hypothetical protein